MAKSILLFMLLLDTDDEQPKISMMWLFFPSKIVWIRLAYYFLFQAID